MLIDFHTHIFPDKIALSTIETLQNRSGNVAVTNGTEAGLYQHMKQNGVDIAIALPVLTKPSQFESVNNFALSINEKYKNLPKKIISFAGIHPKCNDIFGKMQYLKDCGFLGVKIHPDYQNAFIDDDGYIDILTSAKKLDMIVVTHAGVDEGYKNEPVKCPPKLCAKVIDFVKHDKFVLAHLGGRSMWDSVLNCLCGKNVYFDTAFSLQDISENLFKDILTVHGADKIIFATDCPWQSVAEAKKILLSYNLQKEQLDKIFYKNALNLLNI